MKKSFLRYGLCGLALLILSALQPAPASADPVTIEHNQKLTWGTDLPDETLLENVRFTGVVAPIISDAIDDLNTAIITYTSDDASPLSELNAALRDYNEAIDEAQGVRLGTIRFDIPDTITLTDTADTSAQRLNVDTNAAGFDIAAGTTLTIRGNKYSSGDGGAISVGDGGLFAVTGDGRIEFDTNTAVNHGGGIFNSGGTVSFFGPATFKDNTATTGFGGGISNSGGTVSFLGEAIFTGNEGVTGGGISNADGTVSFFDEASFTGNEATTGFGGGIFNFDGTVNFFGQTTFKDNTAANFGGGIYNVGGTVNLMPTNANETILFSGNTAGGDPNSIYMDSSGFLNVGGAGTIDMRDPMAGKAPSGDTITINKSGAGTWKLGGRNSFGSGGGDTTFTVSGGTLHLYREGEEANGTGQVNTGIISLMGEDAKFELQFGTTLSMGGMGHEIIAATIRLDDVSSLVFDITDAVKKGDAGETTNLTLSAGTITGTIGAQTIDIVAASGLPPAGTYHLVYYSNVLPADFSDAGTLTWNGSIPDIAANRSLTKISLSIAAENYLDLVVADAIQNTTLYWTGADTANQRLWVNFTDETSPQNWTDDPTGTAFITQFTNGDAVIFDETGTKKTITINDGGVTVAAMNVESGTYTFSGGGITASTSNTTLADPSGKLTLSGGSADFNGITDTNDFEGGIEISDGTLRVANEDQLGTTLSEVAFKGSVPGDIGTASTDLNDAITNYVAGSSPMSALKTALAAYNTAISDAQGAGLGTIAFSDSITLTDTTGTSSQSLRVLFGKAASFDIADGKTLTIQDNLFSSGDGGAVYLGTGGLFAVTGDGKIIFDANVASGGGGIANSGTMSFSGPAVFTTNSAKIGGGILNDRGAVSFFDEASFTDNTTSDAGGGIHNYESTVSFFGEATFKDNRAGADGGGLYNHGDGSTVNFFDKATFTNNTASGNGGGIANELATINFFGSAIFTDNSASNSGGGLYNQSNTINLTPSAGNTLLFSGNMANSIPNSIHMDNSGALNVGGAGIIDMRDPMAGNAIDMGSGVIVITQSGGSIWKLGGSNTFISTDGGSTTFTVSGGTLHLYRANETNDAYAKPTTGTIKLDGSDSFFTLENGATLSLGGTGHSITTDGTITIADHSTLAFDMTGAVKTGDAGETTNLTLSAGTITGTIGAQTIDIVTASGLPAAGVYHLVYSDSTGAFFSDTGTLTLNGSTLDIAADRSLTKISLSMAAENYLDLVVASAIPNTTLYWTGADTMNQGIWVNYTDATSPQNWTDNPTGTATVTQFADGDTVIFDTTVTQKTVAVDASGVSVAAMTVSGDDDYTFTGGTVTSSSGLTKIGDGMATFDTGVYTGAMTISAGTVKIRDNAYNSSLSGSGTLAVELADSSTGFAFGNSVGKGFTGTIDMVSGTISLDNADNLAVLQNADLRLSSGGSTTVTQDRTIKALTMNGGALKFDVETIAHDGILTVTDLDTTGGGTIQMDVIQPIDTSISTMENWYDYGNSASAKQHQLVSAANITGTGTQIAWQDYQGGALSSQTRTINDGTENVGTATFSYAGAVDATGITLGYTLTELSADSGKIVELDSTGATGTLLNAKLTGDGVFTFSGTTDVSMGNASSDYSGATIIDGDQTVTMLTDNAFGNTSGLTLENAAILNMNGKSQTVGTVSVAADTEIIVGALTVTDGGTIAGTLSGTGTTTQSGGTLAYSGTQNTGAFVQSDGTLNTTNGATLNNATFRSTVNPAGTLNTATATFIGVTLNIGTDPGTNKIVASGLADITGGVTINLDMTSVMADDTYDYALIEGGTFTGTKTDATVNAALSSNQRGGHYIDSNTLNYQLIVGNTTLTWTGDGNAAWNTTDTNWSTGQITTYFSAGDAVIFDGTASNKNVVIDTTGVTVTSMKINDNYSFSGGTITASGEVTVAAGKSLGLNIADNAPILNAASVNFNGGSLNVTGYAPGTANVFDAQAMVATVITTTDGVNNFNPAVTVLNQASVDFLSASARLSGDGRDVLVETGLSWYSTDPNRPAHGDFTIAGGETFTLGAGLIDQSSNADWDGTSLTKEGGGTLILTGDNTHTGGTIVNGGTLQIGNGGTTGSVTGGIVNNSKVAFNRSDEVTYADMVSGTGSVTKDGSGTLILTGNNTYAGGTSVNAGILTAENEDALGTGDITASGNGILVLDFEGEFANHINGTGTAEVAGDGIIFNNSTNVAINVTGTLGGSSTHKSFDVKPGGTVSPGNNGIGAMTVGSLTFESGSFYDVEVEPGGTGSDLLQVTGTAVLSGGTVRHIGLGGTYSPIGEWTILTAGNALTDQFAGVESMYSFLDASLLYGSNDVKLQLMRNDVDFADKAKTPNQKAAARGIESQGTGNQPYDYVVSQLNTADMGAIYDGFSGEMYASLFGEIEKQDRYFTGQMLDRLGNAFAGTTGVAGVASGALTENTDFWISVDGYKNNVGRTSNAAKTEFKGWGASLGVEKDVAEWTFGAAFRYGDSEYKVDSLHSEADLDSFNFGLYAGRSISDFNIKFGAGYGLHQVDSKRRIVATGENLKAGYDMNSFQIFGELGYLKEFGNLSLEPYAGLAWNYAKSDSFTEKGGPSALRAKSESNDNVTSSLGVRGHYKPLETVEIGADLNWQHVFGDENPEARFAFTGGHFFTIEGAPMDRDSVGLGLNMAIKVQDNLKVRAGYVGRFGEDTDSHAGFLSLEFSF